MPGEKDHIVAETAARIFADLADPQTVNRADNGAWKEPLWQTLSDAGLTLAWVPENLGGAGASLPEGFAILGVAGRFALAVPLAETLAAGWMLAGAGLAAPRRSRRLLIEHERTEASKPDRIVFFIAFELTIIFPNRPCSFKQDIIGVPPVSGWTIAGSTPLPSFYSGLAHRSRPKSPIYHPGSRRRLFARG